MESIDRIYSEIFAISKCLETMPASLRFAKIDDTTKENLELAVQELKEKAENIFSKLQENMQKVSFQVYYENCFNYISNYPFIMQNPTIFPFVAGFPNPGVSQ